MDPSTDQATDSIAGALLGCSLGDSIGLPFEGISARRIARLVRGRLQQRFLFGHGMISDDSEHSCLVAQSLIASAGDADRFGRHFAWRLRWWFLSLPAGIGLGTLRSAIRLWLGFPYDKSGVFSAGNGPMMRSAVIGAYARDDEVRRERLVAISTRATHTDPKAERAAQIVAAMAAVSARGDPIRPDRVTDYFAPWIENEDEDEDELRSVVNAAAASADSGQDTLRFCRDLGMHKGVSGYCYHTLPVVLQIWLRHHDDFESAVDTAVRCGGDTDTVGAIVGGIVGAGVGTDGLPVRWLDRLADFPRSVAWMRRLAARLLEVKTTGRRQQPPRIFYPFALARNLLFMTIVLAHGFRRLLPPY